METWRLVDMEDRDDPKDDHRHISHLFALHPGREISPTADPVTGTYTVSPDCTASHAESDGSHYDYVVAPDGNTVTWIKTDPGTVVSGTEVRLRH